MLVEVVNQTPIEIALQIDDDGMTTARKLYQFLELAQGQFSRWAKANIVDNEFATENEDWWGFDMVVEGNKTKDYKITARFAKKLSMKGNGEKAEKARNYFIGCEQALVRLAEQRHKTEIERAKGIAVRQALTKALQQSNENERMHGHAYSTYTDVVYKTVFGKNAKQLREEYGISKKDNLRDCFSAEELERVQSVEMVVSGLVNCGWGYDEIKNFVLNAEKRLIAG